MTRIVAGVAGGRRLTVPPKGTRPTSERVREALFSALEAALDLDGARVLDLYAGSGALGLEALSRGAGHALFVESDRRAADVLRANIATVGLRGAEVRAAAVGAALALPAAAPYDVVFADPPYAVDGAALTAALAALVANGWVTNGALVLVERAARDGAVDWPEPLAELRTRKYGDTAVHWAEWA
ncbi:MULTISPECIES: 16S rRNA (guanine(966)-N(2))-methyltransferase RsmD [unclassified Crossiella]|uniref:16S rRNA (guanine(966)-N(2))-methyltransferase RsmD n=1 Tax=unclassified Crossiella TaxID=2620835 RepID=UPI0020002680|nr:MULTISPECIES: 16S rRNA (guanine(966)-N(2))-methyltransferase RsmD [unclassified Crossiella]MCK2242377.1 16S rRNA (guanine(966)-N(2))-methyltransferase RsmD [Crossiella sp. S99.2]MCK2254592.1 16S rRNA (guanine(966)-N(2))-methyltransferase RsmD [Crossiella sp. S99.1]